MRKILGPVATLSVLLACGCDGYYTYAFHGQLVDAQRAPIASGMSVHVLPAAASATSATVYDSEFGITDEEGKFSGTLVSEALRVPPVGTTPPVINQLRITVSDSKTTLTVPVEVPGLQQKIVKDGVRQIELGVVPVPGAPSTQPAAGQ